jgi:hypothetical protein
MSRMMRGASRGGGSSGGNKRRSLGPAAQSLLAANLRSVLASMSDDELLRYKSAFQVRTEYMRRTCACIASQWEAECAA